ncbi:hypothetical protein [Haladaptatus sp. DYF46]|uniref:DUF7282 domain-containing protein n=1 Tax=Haladaptatus sp. DYF46 TaxID=2886041 RepID=UPI001E558AD6|nr:hypothetical protein [Haladaptatus sp. DYF46]
MNTSEANVTINDQQSDGETLVISSVTMQEGGFVAIHDQSLLDGNVVGSVLGNSVYLEPGTHENVSVTLARPINDTETLIAMPHMDTNSNGVYDFVIGNGTVDGPYTANGEAVVDDAQISVGEEGPAMGNETNQTGQQFVFRIESLSIAEWSFVVGDSTQPDRTEVVSGVDLEDETVHVNTTELLQNGSASDVVQRGPDVSQSDVNDVAEQANATSTDDIDTVRVVLRDITIQNTTFIVDAPRNVSLPNLPHMPGGPGVPEQPTMSNLDADVTFDNQTSDGQTVTVDSATLSEGGFVTIHDSSLLDGNVVGSVVGTSEYLEPGTHENVSVTLNEPLTESQTLIAMPHLDTNDNQVYDFVTSGGSADLPYVVDNNIVADSAYVTVESGGGATTTSTTTAAPTTGTSTTTQVGGGGAATTTTSATGTTTTSGCGCANTTTAAETTTQSTSTTQTTAAQGTSAEGTTTTTQAGNATVENVSDLGPSFSVSNLEAPSNATVGDTISVSATITNPTSQQLTQPVDFRLAGTVVQRQNVTLDADQSTTVTFEIPTTGVAPGTYPHGVYARNFGQLATITLGAGENATTTLGAGENATTTTGTTTQAGTTTSAETTSAGTTTAASQTTTVENATQAETTTSAGNETTQAETTTVGAATTQAETTTSAGNETTQAGTATSAGTDTTNASVVASVLDAFGDLV